MAEVEDDPGGPNHQEEEQWEERSLSLLRDSKMDQELSAAKKKKKPASRGKKHKMKAMQRPTVMTETILEFFEEDLRESAIRYLSNYLLEKREEDLDNYHHAGFLMFNSCATMCILLQEIVVFYMRMVPDNLDVRPIKRLANVLTLFQCVAANDETREKFVNSGAPNFLIPLILFDSEIEIFDYARSVALSVIGILCQGREPTILQWAIKSNIVEACHTIIQNGSELNQVIAMHILEAILQDSIGISYVCDPIHNSLLSGLMKTWDDLVTLLAADQETSPRLLFHVIRCYLILCSHDRGYKTVRKSLPDAITNGSFDKMTEEFPVIRALLHQLLLSVGREVEEPFSCEQVLLPLAEGKNIRLQTCARSALSSESTTPICLGSDRVIFLPSTPFG
ncbi:cell differentiation protein RCD1 homolog [Ananas comosus]|uniref:Cell differentiation protein RCD1 homolog n=1 Tax=Ananas comosus TaxID=4615 RepID=A0A6P5FJQ5_ANACO|nr:cell differentiation protein RCD1 homolog [Ananas comosus]